jgi:hypothetical protein
MMEKYSSPVKNWKKEARLILRAEMSRRGVSYKELARMLAAAGASYDPKSLANKASRGTFSMIFFLQCMQVLGVKTLQLDQLEE